MKSGQIVAFIIVVGVVALALGATIGYSLSSGRTSSVFLESSITSNSSSKNFLFNETFDVYVNYSGAWGLSYQTHLGAPTPSDRLVESGNFFGLSPANESVTVTENNTLLDDYGYLTCFQAQKLDNSSSLLTLEFTSSNSENKTSLAFGTASLCVGNVFTGGTIATASTISSGLNKIVFQESGACDPPHMLLHGLSRWGIRHWLNRLTQHYPFRTILFTLHQITAYSHRLFSTFLMALITTPSVQAPCWLASPRLEPFRLILRK